MKWNGSSPIIPTSAKSGKLCSNANCPQIPIYAFPDRESLLKPELEGSAYTGSLLSYIDGELNKEDTLKIEAVLHDQPLVANELAVLRQIAFRPDPAVVFPEKDRLYRTEKERRIILLPWIRAGIAAAIAGAIALILLLPASRRQQAPVAVTHLRHNYK